MNQRQEDRNISYIYIRHKQFLFYSLLLLKIKNQELAQRIRNGEMQGGQFDFGIEAGQIHVTENMQLKSAMEQNINAHFKFIFKISFYRLVFDEITRFIQKFEDHFNQSQEMFGMWSSLDKLIVECNDRIIWAQNRQREIIQDNNKELERKDLDEYKGNLIESFLNRKFMEDQANKVQLQAQLKARDQATADTAIEFGQRYLKYFQKQKTKQSEFYEVLQNMKTEWKKDQSTYEEGYKFIKYVFDNQLLIYNNKLWNQDQWTQQFNQQTKSANPFFTSLFDKYINCYQFYQDLYALNMLIDIQKQTQETEIELRCKLAEKIFNEYFLGYWKKKFDEENLILQIFRNYDRAQRLKECHQDINQQVLQIQKAFNSINIDVRTGYGGNQFYIKSVQLSYNRMILNFEKCRQGIDQNNQLYLIQEQNIMNRSSDRLEELKKEPNRMQKLQEQKLSDKRNEGKLIQVKFNEILKLSQNVNFDELYFGNQSFQQILREVSRQLVLKPTPCCLCCSGLKKLHERDEIIEEHFQDEVASVIRTVLNLPNSCCTSSQQRIQSANNLNAIRTGTQLILNCRIMAALRNDDGQRQINGSQRVFNINRAIVQIIYEICQVTIADYRSERGFKQSSSSLQFTQWQSSFAKNQVMPQN
ncbi:hypothetical protein pb186bvf_005312 [Paramecium bursaria]